jgi:hypothetical protein
MGKLEDKNQEPKNQEPGVSYPVLGLGSKVLSFSLHGHRQVDAVALHLGGDLVGCGLVGFAEGKA